MKGIKQHNSGHVSFVCQDGKFQDCALFLSKNFSKILFVIEDHLKIFLTAWMLLTFYLQEVKFKLC